jgi:hypothetical protein
MREKQRKKRKTRTKDEIKQKRGKKNSQNKENEPTWQFWLGFEEKLPPRGSGMPRGISGCGVRDNPQTPSRTPGYTFTWSV